MYPQLLYVPVKGICIQSLLGVSSMPPSNHPVCVGHCFCQDRDHKVWADHCFLDRASTSELTEREYDNAVFRYKSGKVLVCHWMYGHIFKVLNIV